MTGPTGAGCSREWPGARLGTHNRYFSQGFQLNIDTFPIPPLLLILVFMFYCSNHGTYSIVVESCVSRCVGAPKVSFMLALLALIGLKKIRSFQKPRRIASSSSSFLPLALPPPSVRLRSEDSCSLLLPLLLLRLLALPLALPPSKVHLRSEESCSPCLPRLPPISKIFP